MRSKLQINNNKTGYSMLIPATVLFIIINIYPFVYGIMLSFTNTNYMKPKGTGMFVGLKNYIEILTNDPEFYSILLYTFIYTIGVVVMSYLLGLLLATLLNKDIKFRSIFRALALLPWLIPSVIAANNWQWILNDQLGFVNKFLINIGWIENPILFLANPSLARITVMMVAVWKAYPFMMVVLLAGLQSIGKNMYEPAYIDGAGQFRVFRYITMPLLRPVSFVAITLMFIWTFNSLSFDNIYLLTGGGPANSTYVLSIQSYYVAFYRGEIGYASAIAILMLLLISILIIVYVLWRRKKGENVV